MLLKTKLFDKIYSFSSVKEVLAKAGDLKSGEVLCGIAAQTEQERLAAKMVLSNILISDIRNNPVVPYEEDEVTRVIQDDLNEPIYNTIKNWTISELREYILDSKTTENDLKRIARGLSSECIAAASKLMGNMDLVYAARKIRNITHCNTTLGLPGRLASRLQPNHPNDDVNGIKTSLFEGLSYASGDAVIGINPASTNLDTTRKIMNMLQDVKNQYEIPTQVCYLVHVTTMMEAMKQGSPSDLIFASISGTQACNDTFGVSLEILEEARQTALKYGTAAGPNVMYFETGQGPENAGNMLYRVLLSDGITWQDCDKDGNFKKSVVQSYTARYLQAVGDADGFSFSWDGFEIQSSVNAEEDTAITIITKQDGRITPAISLGAGYTEETNGQKSIFTASKISSPIYFLSRDGIRTEMYYAGGVMKTTITLPQSAVDKDFKYIVPTLNFKENGKDNILDWYKALSPDNPIAEGSPIPGVSWKAERIESGKTGEAESYRIEILSNQTKDNPMEITFADGYTMSLYAETAESGNGVGIIELDGIYKTNRAPKSTLVDTITTDADGKAVSKLLPIGKYIVMELDAGAGYTTSTKAYEVELKYENQFVPLVWEKLELLNEKTSVEIDLEKGFETAYQSKTYTKGGGAVFGLYAGEEFTAAETKEGYIRTVKAGTLLDILMPDENGKVLSGIQLPDGIYYVKEISTRSDYKVNEMPFYFAAGEEKEDVSLPCKFEYTDDGISGEIVQESFGIANVYLRVQKRYPMPSLTINGNEYALSESMAEGGVKIEAKKDYTDIILTAENGKERKVTLPNGKSLAVNVNANTYRYKLSGGALFNGSFAADEITGTYLPKAVYTGYTASYESPEFLPAEGENLTVKADAINLKTPKAANTIKAEITHSPKTYTVSEEKWVDENDHSLGMTTVTVTKGKVENGKQLYTHSASITYTDDAGNTQIPTVITRIRKNQTTEETVADPAAPILMLEGDVIRFQSGEKSVAVSLSIAGILKLQESGTLHAALEENEKPKATYNGQEDTNVKFVKSVTLARQDHKAKTIQIKLNTKDNLNAELIENEKLPGRDPERPSSSNPAIRTIAKDSKTNDHIALAGKDITIIDTVYFYNLTIGQEYKLVGVLMDKETGKPIMINGKEVTAETTFKPSVSTGTQDISFTFDATTLAGKDVVVFEALYKIAADKDGKTEEKITSHEDINDEGQTITFPEIHTTATGENGEKVIEAKGRVNIIDIVEYQNLIAGKSYTMKGYLVDKKTGKAIYENGEKVTSEVTFVAEDTSGTVEMIFTVNAKALSGKKIVVFEDCYYEDVLVGTHADINDEGQTVKFKAKDGRIEFDTERDEDDDGDVDIVPSVPKTGDRMQLQLMLLLMLASIFGLLVRIRRKE